MSDRVFLRLFCDLVRLKVDAFYKYSFYLFYFIYLISITPNTDTFYLMRRYKNAILYA